MSHSYQVTKLDLNLKCLITLQQSIFKICLERSLYSNFQGQFPTEPDVLCFLSLDFYEGTEYMM